MAKTQYPGAMVVLFGHRRIQPLGLDSVQRRESGIVRKQDGLATIRTWKNECARKAFCAVWQTLQESWSSMHMIVERSVGPAKENIHLRGYDASSALVARFTL